MEETTEILKSTKVFMVEQQNGALFASVFPSFDILVFAGIDILATNFSNPKTRPTHKSKR